VMRVQVVRNDPPAQTVQGVRTVKTAIAGESAGEGPAGSAAPKQGTVVNSADDWSRTPRNSPCPCGSGKKYKQCHGKVA
jgi:preprotein translocase subunit SecA